MHPLMMNWPENFRDRIKSLGDMFGTGVPTDTRMVQIRKLLLLHQSPDVATGYTCCFTSTA